MSIPLVGGNHSQSADGVHPSSVMGSFGQVKQSLNQLQATAAVLEDIGTFVSDSTTAAESLKDKATTVINEVGGVVKNATEVLKEADIIGQLSEKGAAVRLEKATLGFIKGCMTLAYLPSYIIAQTVCVIVGCGMMAISAVDKLQGKSDTTRFKEGASLAIAPSRWLANLLMSTYNDIKGAYTGKGANQEDLTNVMGDQSFVATFKSLEADIGNIFDVDENERDIEQKVAGICKGIIALTATGMYTPPLVISTVFGVTAMASAAYNGQSVQQGANIVASPLLSFGALIKSAYHDFRGK